MTQSNLIDSLFVVTELIEFIERHLERTQMPYCNPVSPFLMILISRTFSHTGNEISDNAVLLKSKIKSREQNIHFIHQTN